MELREIKGFDGFKLQGIFYTMLSLYALKNLQASPQLFLTQFDEEQDKEKKHKIVLNMIKTTDGLDKDDLAFLCSFAKDKAGNPYTQFTVPSLEIDEINEIIASLFEKFMDIQLFFSTMEKEKK